MKLVVSFALTLCVCSHIEYSGGIKEEVVVVETVYTPARHGSGTGFDTDGNITFTNVKIREKFAVVCKCAHGKFIVEGKDVWEKLNYGDTVECVYREIYRVGKDSRELVGFDFLNFIKDGKRILPVDRVE